MHIHTYIHNHLTIYTYCVYMHICIYTYVTCLLEFASSPRGLRPAPRSSRRGRVTNIVYIIYCTIV